MVLVTSEQLLIMAILLRYFVIVFIYLNIYSKRKIRILSYSKSVKKAITMRICQA